LGLRKVARHSPVEVITGAAVLLVAAGFLVYAVASTGQISTKGAYLLNASFDHVDGLSNGADVRIAGVKIGEVESIALNPKTYEAQVSFTVQDGISLSSDSSATVSTDGLLGGKYLALATGGEEQSLKPGGTITITQGSMNIEALIGKYIFGGPGGNSGSAKPAAAPAPAEGKSVMPPLK
jgi:phospholipid/cholesterol/gamma-HCH transport system substrate-binding protein